MRKRETMVSETSYSCVVRNYRWLSIDVDYFGVDAGKFDPERWLNPILPGEAFTEKPSQFGVGHLSFGAGARACSGQFIAQRLLYAALIRILSFYKIVASDTEPPNTDYVDYNQFNIF